MYRLQPQYGRDHTTRQVHNGIGKRSSLLDLLTNGAERLNRLVTLYQQLHDAVHARSGQSTPLPLVYVKTEHEACLAWMTKPFELYITVSPHLTKSAVVAAANAVAKWVAGEEAKLFIKDAPVF